MCACRVEAKSDPPTPQTPVELDDYYSYLEMDRRSDGNTSENEDVYTQLANKERDLILAAELGKALLEKNEELVKKNEQHTEEYNHKLEALTQEKYELRLRLETIEGEYENTIKELQNDITQLRHDLEEQQEQTRVGDKTKSQIISELTQQNERLTEQARKAAFTEDQLQTQLQGMREQVQTRRSSMHQHVHQLEVLREEINVLTERRGDLERRIASLTEERDSLAGTLEESQDRIVMLEKQNREQEQKVRSQERETQELREQNAHLQEKVESLRVQVSNTVFEQSSNSLFSELEISQLNGSMSGDSLDNSPAPRIGEQLDFHLGSCPNSLTVPRLDLSGLMMCEEEEEDDIECDDEVALAGAVASNVSEESLDEMRIMAKMQSVMDDTDSYQLKQEVLEVYRQLNHMVWDLQGNQGEWSQNHTDLADLKAGSLLAVLSELQALMQTIVTNQMGQVEDENCHKTEILESRILSLQRELQASQSQLAKLKSTLELKDQELKHKTDELTELTNKLSLQHQELANLQAERDHLQDLAIGSLSRDDIVDQARKDRDEAVTKRNTMEVELARAKLDLMSLDSQLMEAIQQKIELSQQLEQWQMDMQELIGVQMARRIEQEKTTEEQQALLLESSPKKRFPFPWSNS